tara:strand:- start:570 stop:992 length:423 start_codon:yes stop_codon:yes gene_type:complete
MPTKRIYTDEQKLRMKYTDKIYYQNNKEKRANYQKEYRTANTEKVANYMKEWAKNNPDKVRINGWKKRGIICNDYDLIYGIYVVTNKCDFCQEPFKDSKDRQLDHNHSILDSYNIRGILCRVCNTTDKLKDYPIKEYSLD